MRKMEIETRFDDSHSFQRAHVCPNVILIVIKKTAKNEQKWIQFFW